MDKKLVTLECEFEQYTPETQAMLINILTKHMDLLPGLKIKNMYSTSSQEKKTLSQEFIRDLETIREDIQTMILNTASKYCDIYEELNNEEMLETYINNQKSEATVEEKVKDYPPYLDYPIKQSSPVSSFPKANNGYVDMEDRKGMQAMFDSIKL